ncbi:MAG: hypothetical protein JWQ38_3094 [Flavipsychrobacter sp.]|nr:hypothetical protein [Flavipsychrobacter sp.]
MLKRLFSYFLITCLLLTGSIAGWAQELNCKVTVRHDKITGVDNKVFNDMQKAITEFMNQHKWTTDEFAATEKIDCSIFITLTGNKLNGDVDAYGATISIQATRPVFNASYTTSLINFVDKDFVFKFTQYNPMHFDDNQVSGSDALSSNLTAVLAYYSYIILALDYDSFAPEGGTQFLKRAQNVVNNAPEGKGIDGWKAMQNTRNRYWLIDQMLNTRFGDVRKFWYTMHREGLDSMSVSPVESRNRILANVKKLYNVNKENPGSIYIQFLFNAKGDEMLHLLAQAPKADRAQYVSMLTTMDVPNSAKYNALR